MATLLCLYQLTEAGGGGGGVRGTMVGGFTVNVNFSSVKNSPKSQKMRYQVDFNIIVLCNFLLPEPIPIHLDIFLKKFGKIKKVQAIIVPTLHIV